MKTFTTKARLLTHSNVYSNPQIIIPWELLQQKLDKYPIQTYSKPQIIIPFKQTANPRLLSHENIYNKSQIINSNVYSKAQIIIPRED
jgi:hypothetical protein